MAQRGTFFVAVTGAQGVGKSTFCRNLHGKLAGAGVGEVALLDGLGDRIKGLGIPLGSASTPDTIAAVFTAHLEREAIAQSDMVVLDRCVVDALAYTRSLGVSSELELRLYEQVTALSARRLGFVVHLGLSPFFEQRGAARHESPALRRAMAGEIPSIIDRLSLDHLTLDASTEQAIADAAQAVLTAING